MIFEKHLNFKIIVTFLLGIIPFIVASDCDVLKKSLSYIKKDIYNEIINQNNCCNSDRIKCSSSNQIIKM